MASIELPVKDKRGGKAAIRISPFRSSIMSTEPHRHHGYFELIYLSEGKGIHGIDTARYLVEPPILFVIRKDQVHYWELTEPGQGYVLMISREFVEGLQDTQLQSLFALMSAHNCTALQPTQSVDRLCQVLEDELIREPVSQVAIDTLKALLGKFMESSSPTLHLLRDSNGLYERFLHLLSEGGSIKRTVSHYADVLHTTPQNLNNACRKAVDRSAATVLADFVLSEAKRLLLYTRGSVAEVSFVLDFKDSSHFIKYFKRNTGKTPQAFRRE